MRKAFYAIFFLMPTLVFATPIETDCSIDIIDNIETLNPHATLVVFDLDNTLLTSDQHFGSEQWFEWQKKLMNMPNYEEGRIFTTMEYLFSFGDILNGFLKMHPVDPLWPDLVKGLQDKGYKVIVETARSLTTIEGTVAQLNQNGFNFYRSEIYRLDPKVSVKNDFSFTKEEIIEYKLHNPRPWAYEDGIYYVMGQHKGALLRKLLYETNNTDTFSNIVFIDNDYNNKNLKGVERAFSKFSSIQVFTYKYTLENKAMDEFLQDDFDRSGVMQDASVWLGKFPFNKRIN